MKLINSKKKAGKTQEGSEVTETSRKNKAKIKEEENPSHNKFVIIMNITLKVSTWRIVSISFSNSETSAPLAFHSMVQKDLTNTV